DIYETYGDLDRAVYWLRKVMESSSEANANRMWYHSFVFLSFDLAVTYKYKEALDLIDSVTLKHPPLNPLYKMQLAVVKALIYRGLKQTSLAEKNLSESSVIADQLSSQPQMYNDIFFIYEEDAHIYSSAGNIKKAKECLQKALTVKRGFINLFEGRELAWVQYMIDSSEGKWLSAIQHYKIFQQLSDSIHDLKKTREIEEMNIQYGVAQKEKDLQLLQNRDQLQRAELNREKLVRTIIIIVSSLLLLLFAVLYNRYRLKQRSNKLLQNQQKIISQKNEVLEQTIEEKEWLVREIHHRVKNNLQMVISLLNAQSEFLNHPSAVDAIRESRERMQAIAILHQKLYHTDTSTRINMRSYVNELVDNIRSSVADTGRIEFQVDVDPDIELDISQSVPLGLILNEGITNSIKYAYGANEKGRIRISLRQITKRQLQLRISDHGKGLPEGLDLEHPHSLGLQLIRLFAEQLEGDLYFVNKRGLEIDLCFDTAEYGKVINGKVKV
ncbi:MAG TPA: sensor histidine kinase, partial [Puia sp.]|nr:sensor histidine kinase [Puia sp.]